MLGAFKNIRMSHNPLVNDGLVIRLEAPNSDSYPGSGTTWYDLSGYGNNFTIGNSSQVSFNSSKKHFVLNGNNGSYFYGPAGNASSLSSVSTYFTFFLICRPSSVSQTPFTFNWHGSSGRNVSCHIPWSGNTVYLDVGGCCNADHRINYSTNVTTQIQSAAAWGFRSRSGPTPRREVFYNNVSQVNSGSNTTNTNWTSVSEAITIGRRSDANQEYWKTRLWGFYLYNRGLTDEEMKKMQGYFEKYYSQYYDNTDPTPPPGEA